LNKENRNQGTKNSELTDLGKKQGQLVAKYFLKKKFDL
jgi:broad specificity phosphatase PhoE